MSQSNTSHHPAILIILDGFGHNPDPTNNGILQANTPKLDHLFATYPHTLLNASGHAVGLPEGQMGNSEVGHMTMGGGNIMRQNLVRIDDAIHDGSFEQNRALLNAAKQAKQHQRPLHLIGLTSDGGVHSHINHLFKLITLCHHQQVTPVVHLITDGRDTPPNAALSYLPALNAHLKQTTAGHIATVSGRFYAMDRDQRWDRIKKAWQAMTQQAGPRLPSAQAAIEQAYAKQQTDEFIEPTIITPSEPIQANDVVVFFNFRNDRARQLSQALVNKNFDAFDRGNFGPIHLTTMTQYASDLVANPVFPPLPLKTTLAKTVSAAGIRQLHCAETEKYTHVTFFINGGVEAPLANEDRIMIPSPKVTTYDLAPQMSAHRIADQIIQAILSRKYGLIIVNFANGDMVGHTAIPKAIISAIETLDNAVGRVLDTAIDSQYNVLLTADHGNCELMVDPQTHHPHTQHTTNQVPCLLIDHDHHWALSQTGGLSNIAPTILQLMQLPANPEMHATSLLSPINLL